MALVGLTRATQVLRIYRLSKSSFNSLTENSIKNAAPSLHFHIQCAKHYCTNKKAAIPERQAAPHATEETKKRKGLTSPQITLILSEDEIKSTTLEDAEKLAKRRNLKLVKIVDFDTKTEKPVFKLMTSAQFFEEDVKSKERKRKEKESAIKDDKMFSISSKIADHDLAVKVKQMFKALSKKHAVRVYIFQDGNPSRAEELAKIMEEELKEVYSMKENTKRSSAVKLFFKPKVESENVDENKKGNKEKIEESHEVKVKAK